MVIDTIKQNPIPAAIAAISIAWLYMKRPSNQSYSGGHVSAPSIEHRGRTRRHARLRPIRQPKPIHCAPGTRRPTPPGVPRIPIRPTRGSALEANDPLRQARPGSRKAWSAVSRTRQ